MTIEPTSDAGFCYIRRWPQGNSSINHTILGEMIGYSLWSYITFITITGLYIYLFIRVVSGNKYIT